MAKIVINTCYGGFSLSREAVLLGRELSGNPEWCPHSLKEDKYPDGSSLSMDFGRWRGSRSDPTLVQIVEQIGEKANGAYANLAVVSVPDGTRYCIQEYDGNERIETEDEIEWLVAGEDE